MRAVCDDATFLQNMLDFEAALARAEAATGVISPAAASTIASACRAETFDIAMLLNAATRSGNLAIPLVKIMAEAVSMALAEKVGKSDAHHLIEHREGDRGSPRSCAD